MKIFYKNVREDNASFHKNSTGTDIFLDETYQFEQYFFKNREDDYLFRSLVLILSNFRLILKSFILHFHLLQLHMFENKRLSLIFK